MNIYKMYVIIITIHNKLRVIIIFIHNIGNLFVTESFIGTVNFQVQPRPKGAGEVDTNALYGWK